MTSKNLAANSWLGRVVLISWLACSAIIILLLGNIDNVVHDQLYDFGLQFSFVWANPYWIALRLIYVLLAIPSILSAISLGLDFWKMFKGEEITLVKKHEPIKKHVPKPVSKPTPKPVSKSALKAQNAKGNSMLISCPMCKKTFGKPMVMLDFSSGKAKLVNTCPYCNKILGETDESEEKKEFETRVLSPDEKTDAEKQRWR